MRCLALSSQLTSESAFNPPFHDPIRQPPHRKWPNGLPSAKVILMRISTPFLTTQSAAHPTRWDLSVARVLASSLTGWLADYLTTPTKEDFSWPSWHDENSIPSFTTQSAFYRILILKSTTYLSAQHASSLNLKRLFQRQVNPEVALNPLFHHPISRLPCASDLKRLFQRQIRPGGGGRSLNSYVAVARLWWHLPVYKSGVGSHRPEANLPNQTFQVEMFTVW